MIDDVDAKILTILQSDARTSNAQIARDIGMAPSAILERIRKLESRGIIRGYSVRLDARALGLPLLAFVFVRSDELAGSEELGRRIAGIPEVEEVHHVAGEDCYLVKVRAADAQGLGRLLRERFGPLGAIRTRTTIVLETVREGDPLPILLPSEGPP